jgi:serine-type D-Ala-D-Ala carboxypeptidase
MTEPTARAVPSAGDPALAGLLVEMVGSGAATAAAVALGGAGSEPAAAWAGWARPPRPGEEPGAGSERALGPRDRFDLASLTKPISASLALRWEARGRLPLATQLGDIWEGAAAGFAATTLEDLLRHRAGFARWAPLYALCGAPSEIAGRLLDGGLQDPGLVAAAESGYSDLDYLLWGLSAERALGEPLARLFEGELAELGSEAPAPHPAAESSVECRMDGAREVELAAARGLRVESPAAPSPGTVQDGNARFAGGMAGHAGLFASLDGMWRVAEEWIAPSGWLAQEGVERALAGTRAPGGAGLLGWTRPADWRQTAGRLPERCYGHLGFTGGSVWLESSTRRGLVLLAHRASPSADLDPWRRELYDRLASESGGQDAW